MSLAIALILMAQTASKPRATPVPRSSPTPPPTPFQSATDNFLICMQHLVETAEIARTPPPEFATTFATSCKTEENLFRTEATRVAIAQGRTPDVAAKEIETNIASTRRMFVANEAAYIAPDKKPTTPAPTPAAKKKRPTRRPARKPS